MLSLLRVGLSIAIFFCYPIARAESATNKCTDGKKITYANMPCEKLGLKSAGPVKDAVTVVPAIQKPKNGPSDNSAKEHEEKGDISGADVPEAEKIKPVNSLIEKLMQ